MTTLKTILTFSIVVLLASTFLQGLPLDKATVGKDKKDVYYIGDRGRWGDRWNGYAYHHRDRYPYYPQPFIIIPNPGYDTIYR